MPIELVPPVRPVDRALADPSVPDAAALPAPVIEFAIWPLNPCAAPASDEAAPLPMFA